MQEQSLALLCIERVLFVRFFFYFCAWIFTAAAPYLTHNLWEKKFQIFLYALKRLNNRATTMMEFIRDFYALIRSASKFYNSPSRKQRRVSRNISVRESPFSIEQGQGCSHRGNPGYTHLNVAFDPPHALFSLGRRRVRFVQRSDCRVASTPELQDAIRK